MFLKCFCVLLIYLFDFIFCATINDASLFKETFIIRYFEGRKIVPVKVELDAKNQTELIQILSTTNSWISISLHDFIEEKKAFKDSNGSQCFISSAAHETMEDDRKKLRLLNNGIVKGSYIPTFYILKEIDDETNISEKFGKRIARFCNGSSLSFVSSDGIPLRRKKRQTVGNDDKGKFTHHSYGHYGHQSNNYAHYGHDTRITGKIDKDGNLKDQTVTQYQERSQGSQTYPMRGTGNLPHASAINGRNTFTSPAQNQNFISMGDNTGRSRSVNFGGDSSGQFSLQTAQESGYQLNLPFGLKAGNAYRGGISSSGQYGASRGTPYHLSEQKPSLVGSGSQRYPSASAPGSLQGYPGSYDISKSPESFQPGGMSGSSYLSPPISRADQRSLSHDTKIQYGRPSLKTESTYPVFPGVSDMQQQGGIPGQLTHSHAGSGGSSPLDQIKTITPESESQIRPGTQYQPPLTRYQSGTPGHTGMLYPPGVLPDTTISGYQPISGGYQPISGGYQPSSVSRLPTARGQPAFPGYQPSSLPGTLITATRPVISGYQPSFKPGTDITGGLPVTSVYKPGSHQGSITQELAPSTLTAYPPDSLPQSFSSGYQPGHFATGYQDLDQQRSGVTSGQHTPKALNGRSPQIDSRHPGTIPGVQISQPRYHDSRISTDQRQIHDAGVDQRLSPGQVPGASSGIPTNLRALDSFQSQPRGTPRDTLQGGAIVPGSLPSHPFSVPGTGDSGHYSRPQILDTSSYNVPDLTSGGVSEGSRIGQSDVRTGSIAQPVRTALENKGVPHQRGVGDSASSQTQIQTGAEGTAAEASAAGQYRGIGSKTQVQGGYAGNGSFSAQAQSGFSGGITQSQVQGGKQGGLSGSSAAVENVGSAQSQVQIGRPSGSASSTAQGRFSHGMTSVRAQSGRTGGSAGAESQSRGLSSSQVQVDIAGKEVTGNNDFQGTVSASVLGGSSTGQSQTQLQGGYNAGRTYAATAQGGFDAAMDYQGSVPMPETLPVFSAQNLDRNANIMQTSQIPSSGALNRPSINGIASPSTTIRESGVPVSIPMSTPRRVSQEQVQGSRSIPDILQSSGTEHIPGTPSRSTGSINQYIPDQSQNNYDQRSSGIRYPAQTLDHYPPSHLTRSQPQLNIPRGTSYKSPISIPGSSQTDLTLGAIPFEQQYYPHSGSQTPMMQPLPGRFHETPSNLQPSHLQHSYHSPTEQQQSGYHPIQQPLPDLSQLPQSMGSQGRINGLQPFSNTQEAFQPSPAFRTQNGIRSPDSSTQFGQPLPYLPPYPAETQNGDFSQIYSKRDQAVPTDSGSSDGAHPTSYLQPHFRPGQPQPPFQVPSQSIGHATAPGQQIPSLTGHLSTAIGIPSSPISFSGPEHRPSGQTSSLVPSFRPSLIPGQHTFPEPEHRSTGQTSSLESSLRPGLTPGQQTLTAPTTDRDISSQQRPIQRPGVREPDSSEEGGCCEALKNLKRRCCGKSAQKQNGSCCTSIKDDFTQDFEDEDLTDGTSDKEPCKIVKAICYIVYKPVGKARICKPTTSNNC